MKETSRRVQIVNLNAKEIRGTY